MSRLKTLFNVLRHPIQTARSYKTFNRFTKSPAFTDTVKKLFNDPNTITMSFDDLESGAWKNASNAATKALTNYGDDAAKLVSNYGDDAARAVTNYYDDALKTVGNNVGDYIPSGSNYYDDALRAIYKADGTPFVGTVSGARRPVQAIDIEPYIDEFGDPNYVRKGVRIDDRWFTDPGQSISKVYSDYLEDLSFYADYDPFEEVLQRKGLTNSNTKANILDRMVNGNRSYDAPTSAHDVRPPLGYGELHPHANTAIGKWWKKNYRNGTKYLDPVGPTTSISDDEYLPF